MMRSLAPSTPDLKPWSTSIAKSSTVALYNGTIWQEMDECLHGLLDSVQFCQCLSHVRLESAGWTALQPPTH